MNIITKLLKLLGLYKELKVESLTTITSEKGKLKVALCVGINRYPNPSNNLQGCVNDASDFAAKLKEVYSFDNVVTLFDEEANYNNVTRKISELLSLNPDVFVYTNSSHGTRVFDNNKEESDGYCEAICLYDRFLMDHDFKNILSKANPKTHVIVFSDSCHSSGVTREFMATMNDSSYISIPKYMPPQDNMEALRMSMLPISRAVFEPNENMNEVLLAGCKSDQFSFDARFNGKPNGAFTYYSLQVLNKNPHISYEDFIKEINQYLPSSRYPQCPVCETNSNMKKTAIFS